MLARLVSLSINDGMDVYEMLQRIGPCENKFKNTAHGLTREEFRAWLRQQFDWSEGRNLPEGFVAQSVYWFYDGEVPVGIGKIRHELTENSKNIGGNIGYAIDPRYRGKGYGSVFVKQLVAKAKELGVNDILFTIEKYNPASRRVVEKSGGRLIRENEERWFYSFE